MLGARTLKLRRDVGPHQQMTQGAKVMVVTMTFSTKKVNNLAVLEARTLEPRRDVGLDQMTLMAKVKVTVTSSTKQAYNCNA